MQRDAHGQTTCCLRPPYADSGNLTHLNFSVSVVSLSTMEGGLCHLFSTQNNVEMTMYVIVDIYCLKQESEFILLEHIDK
jgi:hypothetical protein